MVRNSKPYPHRECRRRSDQGLVGDFAKDRAKEIARSFEGETKTGSRIMVQSEQFPAKRCSTRSDGDTIEKATATAAVRSRLA